MNWQPTALAALMLIQSAGAVTLEPDTLQSWKDYIADAKSRMLERLGEKTPIRCSGCSDSIQVSPTHERSMSNVPSGLIHDWTGTVFIPGVSIEDVSGVLRDYRKYPEFYTPYVIEAHALRQDSDQDRFEALLRNRAVLNSFVLDGDFLTTYIRPSASRQGSITESTRLQEIDDYRLPTEHKHELNEGHGYIWRSCSLTILEQRDGGVYLEMQAMALSRDVPYGLKWLLAGKVQSMARKSVTKSLSQTREAVIRTRAASKAIAKR